MTFTSSAADGDGKKFLKAAERNGGVFALLQNPGLLGSMTDEIAGVTGETLPDIAAMSQTPQGMAKLMAIAAQVTQAAYEDDLPAPSPLATEPVYQAAWKAPALSAEQALVANLLVNVPQENKQDLMESMGINQGQQQPNQTLAAPAPAPASTTPGMRR